MKRPSARSSSSLYTLPARCSSRRGWPRWAAPLALALAVYGALLASHAALLRLPYYWDEAGYYIPAALDCFRHGWLIPRSTLANGHPPLLSLYLAAVWSLAGLHIWATRAAMLAWAAALICGVYALAAGRLGRRAAAVPALLVALAPLVFAQSSLAQLDLPVAALVIWALVAREGGRPWGEVGLLAAACLMKETAVIVPAVLLVYEMVRRRPAAAVRGGRGAAALGPAPTLRLLIPVAVLGAWFVYYHAHTGYWFGNPQYFAYNVGGAAASLPRILLSLARRLWQLTLYDGSGALTCLALLGCLAARRRRRPRGPGWPAPWLLVMAAYVLFHAVVGGAVLARYLLPALALYYIVAAEEVLHLPRAVWWAAGGAAVLVSSWFWNPPYPFPYEDNLAYVHFVRLHQAAARELERHPPAGPILTAWPATDELTRPALGYVSRPLPVQAVQDFRPASLAAVKRPPAVLYLYSRVYQPDFDLTRDTPWWANWSRRYYAFAAPAPPRAWLVRLHLAAFFHRSASGQWVLLAAAKDRRGARAAALSSAAFAPTWPAVQTAQPRWGPRQHWLPPSRGGG
ncbi:MAG: glycosyltransferase family 39 protein [Terriglobales bacterium]